MTAEKLDLLVFGDTAVDYFYEVDRLPKVHEASDVRSGRRFYGGMGANTAVVAKSLGLKVGLVSVIGTDADDYRAYLEHLGIKLYLKGIFGETTKSMFFKTNGNEISFFQKGVTEKLDELDLEREFGLGMFKNTSAIYLGRTYLKLQRQAVKHSGDRLKVYNPGYGVFGFEKIPRDFELLVKSVNILILNKHEAEHLESLGYKPTKARGPATVIITNGSSGCSIYTKTSEVDVGVYKSKVVDASGAGDAFNAGLITALLKGHEIYDAVRIGNATASFVVEEWGCQTNLPSWDKVLERHSQII
ncbi:MAG: PfkB family carbohydrate kinase [Candidatus Altiarchaeota archaeon]|nr:PfkB family carbohydrate kinase [Candidatus Altiarchaeota archaeon]